MTNWFAYNLLAFYWPKVFEPKQAEWRKNSTGIFGSIFNIKEIAKYLKLGTRLKLNCKLEDGDINNRVHNCLGRSLVGP